MKLNWGNGILVFIIFFVLAVVAFFIYTFSVDYHLVEEDYYPKELEYGKRMEQISNTSFLAEKISFSMEENNIRIKYPSFFQGKQVAGTVHVYRPSDASMDQKFGMAPDSTGKQLIPAGRLAPGKYILKFEWEVEGIEYYQEEIFIR